MAALGGAAAGGRWCESGHLVFNWQKFIGDQWFRLSLSFLFGKLFPIALSIIIIRMYARSLMNWLSSSSYYYYCLIFFFFFFWKIIFFFFFIKYLSVLVIIADREGKWRPRGRPGSGDGVCEARPRLRVTVAKPAPAPKPLLTRRTALCTRSGLCVCTASVCVWRVGGGWCSQQQQKGWGVCVCVCVCVCVTGLQFVNEFPVPTSLNTPPTTNENRWEDFLSSFIPLFFLFPHTHTHTHWHTQCLPH